jgi:hypothetical protein
MIELTPEQAQAVKQGEPVRVLDPQTHDAYVVVRAEVYERLAGGLQRPTTEPPAGIEPLMLRSMEAFWRDLPGLVKDSGLRGTWVAYHGDQRMGFGKTQTELYQESFRRGLQRGEFYVGRVEEDGTPPWGTLQGDRSLYEFIEGGGGDVSPDAE